MVLHFEVESAISFIANFRKNIAACTRPTLLALREDQRRRIRQDLCGRAARLAFFILLTTNIRLYCEGNLSHRLDRLHSLPFI